MTTTTTTEPKANNNRRLIAIEKAAAAKSLWTISMLAADLKLQAQTVRNRIAELKGDTGKPSARFRTDTTGEAYVNAYSARVRELISDLPEVECEDLL